MNNILTRIIEQKKIEIAKLDLVALRQFAWQSPRPRDFISALRQTHGTDCVRLIAEIKRASPSKGILAAHLDLFQVADIYTQNGAAAISVLTDEKFFLGKLETLRELRFSHAARLPLLRKDFIIDESQLFEARANGADAVLLIVAALTDDARFTDLHACARELGLTSLVEVHNPVETERALRLKGINLIGINNRNLETFEVSLDTTEQIRPMIPAGITVVSESGIFNSEDVARLSKAGVDAVLVGEALVTAPDIPAKVQELSSVRSAQ